MGKLYIEVFDINLLYNERQEAINRLNKIEDEIAHLNNQTTIDIDFSAPSRQLLGLE
ncbi:MAG: hypothetical protein IGQ45_01120 [Cyanobacterium sp. T60_A2020_053]|nr:hypothetical protein [Cyanobacterium sp. T60_A2020_053]